MYVCGPTVQSKPHIGHGRAAVSFDVVRRYLEWLSYEVTYVQNITDVDDKIIDTAKKQDRSVEEVVAESIEAFRMAYRFLGVIEPTVEPRATEHVPEMIGLIQDLIEGEHAYQANGDVYFAVRSFSNYGKLSGRNIDGLMEKTRIESGEYKRDPLDFALWKAAKPEEPTWESPWGPGRPGWHIECSAMARQYLGDAFDIHAGGSDLIFPHHENEIAQAEAATERTFCRYWIHNGMVNLSGEKMSKSTGHSVDLLEILKHYKPLAVRLFYLRTHYRKSLDFSAVALEDAERSLERIWAFRRRSSELIKSSPDMATLERFKSVVGKDFDMSGGLAVLFDTVREGNALLDAGADASRLFAAYDEIVGVLGIAQPEDDFAAVSDGIEALVVKYGLDAVLERGNPVGIIDLLVAHRTSAREEGDYATSDVLREDLAGLGIIVEDTIDGTRWHRS